MIIHLEEINRLKETLKKVQKDRDYWKREFEAQLKDTSFMIKENNKLKNELKN